MSNDWDIRVEAYKMAMRARDVTKNTDPIEEAQRVVDWTSGRSVETVQKTFSVLETSTYRRVTALLSEADKVYAFLSGQADKPVEQPQSAPPVVKKKRGRPRKAQ